MFLSYEMDINILDLERVIIGCTDIFHVVRKSSVMKTHYIVGIDCLINSLVSIFSSVTSVMNYSLYESHFGSLLLTLINLCQVGVVVS